MKTVAGLRLSRRTIATIVALMLAVAVLIVVLVSRPDPRRSSLVVGTTPATTSTTPTAEPTVSEEGWTVLPGAPIGARSSHTMTWTGSEVIVWSGTDAEHEVEGLTDGAIFNPKTGAWRTVPPAPIHARHRPVTVWTGEEVLFLGGTAYEGTIGGAAAYRPATDTWRTIPEGPHGEAGAAYAWTGERLITWGGGSGYDDFKLNGKGGSYDPSTNKWTPIKEAPISPRYGPAFA